MKFQIWLADLYAMGVEHQDIHPPISKAIARAVKLRGLLVLSKDELTGTSRTSKFYFRIRGNVDPTVSVHHAQLPYDQHGPVVTSHDGMVSPNEYSPELLTLDQQGSLFSFTKKIFIRDWLSQQLSKRHGFYDHPTTWRLTGDCANLKYRKV